MFSVKEASARLKISISKCYDLVSKKKISHYRDENGPIRFAEAHILEYLASIEHGRGETRPVRRTELKHLRG